MKRLVVLMSFWCRTVRWRALMCLVVPCCALMCLRVPVEPCCVSLPSFGKRLTCCSWTRPSSWHPSDLAHPKTRSSCSSPPPYRRCTALHFTSVLSITCLTAYTVSMGILFWEWKVFNVFHVSTYCRTLIRSCTRRLVVGRTINM